LAENVGILIALNGVSPETCRQAINSPTGRIPIGSCESAGNDQRAVSTVNNSVISHNNIGVQSSGSVRLSNSDIAFNNIANSGNTGTFGNNRLSGNSALGNPLTSLGGASSDLAQQ
jgi:hypothetical protein